MKYQCMRIEFMPWLWPATEKQIPNLTDPHIYFIGLLHPQQHNLPFKYLCHGDFHELPRKNSFPTIRQPTSINLIQYLL